ncbi:MAG: hypothetical protein MAG794_00716 [Gammaproteobacteria bacterium]|nr:hypothetical protein [Gammaproteobacteria bacterium]
MDTVRIMVTRHASFYSPLLAAINGRFLTDHGITCEYRIAKPELSVPMALRGGRVDLGQLAVSASWADMQRGRPNDLRHFAQINCRDGFFLVSRHAYKQFQWTDLLEREVLVDHLGQPLAMFEYACFKQGIDLQRVALIDRGEPEEMLDAFRGGEGDFIHLQGPAAQLLELEGSGHVVAAVGNALEPVAFSSLVSMDEWLATDVARRFTRGFSAAREFVRTEAPERVAELVRPFFEDVDASALSQSISAYRQLGCWEGGIRIGEQEYNAALEVFRHGSVISGNPPYYRVVVDPPAMAPSPARDRRGHE